MGPKPKFYTLNGITKKAIDGDLHDARFIDQKIISYCWI